MNKAADTIPVMTDIIEDDTPGGAPAMDRTSVFLGEIEAHLAAVIHDHADELVHNACREMGKKFEAGEVYIPHLMVASEIVSKAMAVLAPKLAASQSEDKDRPVAVIGTVEGDIHDIGKNIVIFLLEANGFEVLDIGINQKPAKFVEGIKSFQPAVVGMSGLLTLAFDSMKKTVEAIKEAGLRDSVRIVIGGGVVTEKIRDYAGADAYAPDAMAGVRLCKVWIRTP